MNLTYQSDQGIKILQSKKDWKFFIVFFIIF